MSPTGFVKTIVVVAMIGYLAFADVDAEARSVEETQQALSQMFRDPNLPYQGEASPYMFPVNPKQVENMDDGAADSDQDDDGAELSGLQPQAAAALLEQAGSNLYQNDRQPMYNQDGANVMRQTPSYNMPRQQQVQSTQQTDLKTSASHHHHGHKGAKGWLDMGAWTGKKGAFGWYDKHPVGKGK